MSRLRVLVLGPDCNPEEASIPFVTYSHAAALAQLHDVTLVAREAVFPELTMDEIDKTTSDGTINWDSLAWVTLIALVQEEFQIELDIECLESRTSFENILTRVTEAVWKKIPVGSAHA